MFEEDLFKKVLTGEKIVTRRTGGLDVINSEKIAKLDTWELTYRVDDWSLYPNSILRDKYKKKKGIYFILSGTGIAAVVKPKYKPGETVYLKEPCGRISGIMFYKYDYPEGHKMRTEFKGWANKMFMKAESARYKIRITDVRLERVQDITNEDAWREGVSDSPEYNCIALFQNKWIKINGISSWKPNPFVFVYCFERL